MHAMQNFNIMVKWNILGFWLSEMLLGFFLGERLQEFENKGVQGLSAKVV